MPVLGCSRRLSVELDPPSSVIGVWEIGCGLAVGCPIILSPCVRIPKRSFYEDQVMFGC